MQVCQLQGEVTFMTPMMIRLVSMDGMARPETIQIDERQERVTLSIPFNPVQVEADPDQELLAATQVEKVESLSPCGE
jgi:hypothetical protein